jgi:hypothetical protein
VSPDQEGALGPHPACWLRLSHVAVKPEPRHKQKTGDAPQVHYPMPRNFVARKVTRLQEQVPELDPVFWRAGFLVSSSMYAITNHFFALVPVVPLSLL